MALERAATGEERGHAMTAFTESTVESAALAWLEGLGWQVKHGPDISPGGDALTLALSQRERGSYSDVILEQRLRAALARLNPDLPAEALEDVFRRVTQPEGATLEARNRAFHRLLVDGVTVEYRRPDGSIAGAQARVIDFDDPENNDWLAVNQFTVAESKHTRRPDVVLFVNGLPLAVIELKNPADEDATVWTAFQQLQTYKAEIPALLVFNEVLVVSDGVQARIGTLTAGREWFKPWRTVSGEQIEDVGAPELEVLLKGIFEQRRFLDFLRDFIVFADEGGRLVKKAAGYHQFHAIRVAVAETLRTAQLRAVGRATDEPGRNEAGRRPGGRLGDRRIGVVWHTQGSGKSLTMAFYAGRIVREPAMENPTVVVLTDRNDLDDQLFGTFSRCQDLLRQPPVQAESRAHLRGLLSVTAGGVVFTTIQKFMSPSAAPSPQPSPSGRGGSEAEGEGDWRMPVLSERRNIVVIADEAHRSQYDFIDGFARHMRDALPQASFIGFTGTPIELQDANTRAVFGDYISVYDIQRAVADGATVPIYYESRLAKLALDESERPRIDPDFEEATEGEEVERKEKLKTKWAQLEAVVGAEKRLQLVAQDIVDHFEKRLEVMDGKAMIVCMSRRICVELYREIVKLRPEWESEADEQGAIKVVMTGSASDPAECKPHARNKQRRETLANRFRDPADPLRLVLVRDMWLTGFDCPSLHTMYLDKPMRGHGLMQATARVNRVFRDKPGGLVVDFGFDRSKWTTGTPQERLGLLPVALEHILAQENGKDRCMRAVRELSRAFALAVPHEAALRIRDDVAFFQAVQAALAKRAPGDARPEEEIEHAVRQIIGRAVAPEGVVDIFAAAGLAKPDISILSEEFLAEVRGMPQRNLAVELLRKLLVGEIKTRRRKNVVLARSFAEMLEETIRRYQNRAIEAAQVIEELIDLAREMRELDERGVALDLSEEEIAFYDALGTNDSAVKVLGDETLRTIARELVATVRANVTIDWTMRENVRAQLRVLVKRTLRKYGYPPDKEDKATQTVLEQAEVLSQEWAAA
ncbi:MAG: type I restriction endonuclease subunit R [Dehalococcoidia bacterium]